MKRDSAVAFYSDTKGEEDEEDRLSTSFHALFDTVFFSVVLFRSREKIVILQKANLLYLSAKPLMPFPQSQTQRILAIVIAVGQAIYEKSRIKQTFPVLILIGVLEE